MAQQDSATHQKKSFGILMVNLGTPEAPTPKAVRAYLKEFLSDLKSPPDVIIVL